PLEDVAHIWVPYRAPPTAPAAPRHLPPQTALPLVSLLRECLRDHLSDVLYEKLGVSRGLHGVFKHRDAEGAGNRENVSSRFFRFLHPDHPDLLPFGNLIPYVRTSTAAAEAVQSSSPHLQKLETCGRLEDISRCVEDTVHPPEVAGGVVRNSLVEPSDLHPPPSHHLADE